MTPFVISAFIRFFDGADARVKCQPLRRLTYDLNVSSAVHPRFMAAKGFGDILELGGDPKHFLHEDGGLESAFFRHPHSDNCADLVVDFLDALCVKGVSYAKIGETCIQFCLRSTRRRDA